jgi:hypothetical protein
MRAACPGVEAFSAKLLSLSKLALRDCGLMARGF